MKTPNNPQACAIPRLQLQLLNLLAVVLITLGSTLNSLAATKTSAATGNWNTPATWSPSGVPAAGDDVIIHSGHVITVDGTDTCRSLYIGDATAAVTTLTVTTGNSLLVTGDLQINPNNKASTYTLDAGAGTIEVAGTFSTWSTTGTNTISVGTGMLSFTPAVAITSANQNITFTAAGTINFLNSFTDSYNKLVTFASCVVNFSRSYTVNTTAASWAGKGTAVFKGNGYSITPTSNLTLFNVQFDSTTTLNSAAGTVVIGGDVTLSSGSSFTANQNFEVDGNWTNNGGTLSAGSNTISFNGTAKTIGGTGTTSFPNVQMGVTAVTVSYTMNNNNSCNNLTFHSTTTARTLTISAGVTFNIAGDLTINQPSAAVTNQLAVNAGVCTVSGNLIFSGASNTTTRVGRVAVTSGAFTLNGTVTWMGNTAVATEVITVSTGSLTFGSSVTMGSGSGTISVTSTGTINFNGTTAPSFNFGGAATVPVFTTTAGCSIYFAKGFTNNTNALTLNATSTAYFSGNGTITPNAAITFGNIQFNASVLDTLASGSATIIAGNLTLSSGAVFTANQNFQVNGNWTNNGGTLNATGYTVSFNGTTKTIGGTSSTTFYNVQMGATAVTVSYTMNNNNTFNNLTFHSSTTARTLTISAGDTLTINGDLTINQPGGAVTNQLAVNAGVCNVTGNLVFSGATNTATWVGRVAVTTGAFTVNGTVTWMGNTAVATEVITVSTGNITFGNSITMGSGSGTISVTSTGTINFNGTTAPSFNFGGAATVPVFTTTAGCSIYFAKGFTNNTNALVLNATSTAYFSGNGAITPNAAITFGHVQINGPASDTLASGAGAVIVAGNFTLSSGSAFVTNQDFEIDGNWTNNGGTLDGGNNTISFNGTTKTIGGTSNTTFYNVQMGATAVTVSYTMNNNNTFNNLTFHSSTTARTLTISAGDTLTINGDLTINQPGGAVTNQLAVNAGVCNVTGNLVFSGATNTATWVGRVAVTTGAFTVNGTVTWMGNTAVATEVITVSTGSLTFGSSVTMGSNSGTISVTSTGTINFNGTTAPSFNFGGAATVPVFTTTAGCSIYFAKGFTNNTNALVLNATSTTYFSGDGAITPNAAITFGHVQINGPASDTLASGAGAVVVAGDFTLSSGSAFVANQNFEVDGNWTNNGGILNGGNNTISFNGNTKTIGGTSSTTFYNVQMGATAVTVSYTMNNNNTFNNLTFHSSTTARTLTISAGDTLTINGDLTINQPGGAVTNQLAVNAGVCNVTGNLVFSGAGNTATWVGRVAVTTGAFTVNGTVTWMGNTAVATEVITVSTGSITFGNSITMGSGSGTISATGTGTINFNGTSAPSFTFGGAATVPVFITAAGSNIYFVKGLTNNTNALTFNATSNAYFSGTGSITPNAAITFGNVQINPSGTTTLASGAGALTVAGNLTLASGSALTANQNLQITGNWINDGGTFTPGTATVTFNSTTANQSIQGLASSETFYNLIVNKTGYILSIAGSMRTINLNGNLTLTAGFFDAGTATDINMTAGNWINNGGTFTPGTSTVTFNGTGAQAINGTAASQTFNKLTINKSSNTLSIGGSTTALTANSDITLAAGAFDKGTATTINAGGNWTNNGGSFTYGTGTVNFNGSGAQAINGTAITQTFYKLTVNKLTDTLSISGSTATVAVNNTLTFTNGMIKTGSNKISIPTTGSVSGAAAGKYIYGNEEIFIPNSAAPSKTFDIGDASTYAPVTLAFSGTVSGSGSITAATSAGDDADINNSGINSSKSVNRTWTLANSGVAGFTSHAPTFTFVAGDIDGGAATANFEVRRLTGGTWSTTTVGSRTGTSTQATGETTFGKYQIGEKNTLTVAVHPADTSGCYGSGASFTSSSSSIPAPSVKWQRDPNTGIFSDITGVMDGGVYSGYTSNTLVISDITALNGYKYRCVFTNLNGSVNSNQATLTASAIPTVTSSTPGARCDAGTVNLGASPSAGTINWYAASSGGASLGSGTTFTTPSISNTTTYYAEATTGGCNSASRTSVIATVSTTPTATIAYQSCAGVDGNTTIRVNQTGGTSPFTYKKNSGGFSSTDTFHIANGSNNNFYVQDVYGCTSAATNYTATSVVPTQIAAAGASATCNCPSVAEGRDVYLTDASGNLVAIINDRGHDLQTITASVYMHAGPVVIANNQGSTSAAMGRSFVLDFTGTNLSPAVEVKFPYTTTELNELVAAAARTPDVSDDISSATDLGSTQYEGPDEDSIYDASSATLIVHHRQLGNGNILNGKYVKIGLASNGEHWLHGSGNGAALPVKLISFTATANDALNRVETKWTTSLEINNNYFAVERSEDGINFNEVGRVTGAGNYTGMLDYRFDDTKPFIGVSYYRLRQTDFDGQFAYSDVKSVTFGPYGFVQVYPNPTTEQAHIEVSHPGKDIKLEVFDMNGRQVYGRTFETEYAGKTQVLSFNAKEILPVGMYMVSINTNGNEYRKKLVLN